MGQANILRLLYSCCHQCHAGTFDWQPPENVALYLVPRTNKEFFAQDKEEMVHRCQQVRDAVGQRVIVYDYNALFKTVVSCLVVLLVRQFNWVPSLSVCLAVWCSNIGLSLGASSRGRLVPRVARAEKFLLTLYKRTLKNEVHGIGTNTSNERNVSPPYMHLQVWPIKTIPLPYMSFKLAKDMDAQECAALGLPYLGYLG